MALDTFQITTHFSNISTSNGSTGSQKKRDEFSRNAQTAYAIGSGVQKANKGWSDARTLSGTETLDLAGALINGVGDACVFSSIKGLYIRNTGTSGTLTIDTGVANGATALFGSINLGPGEEVVFQWRNGKTVTPATADLLRFVSTASLVYEISIAGE